jgi:hypothetical protein
LWIAGGDPISYKARGVDPRLSKGGLHIFREFDPEVDSNKPREEWESYNFVVQYLHRPDEFEMFGEDVIKMLRFWSCSINPEDNVQALRQHLDSRGYGRFVMYRRDFNDVAISGNGDLDRPVRSNEEVISTYVRKLNTFFNRHGHRVMFPELLEQALIFDPNDTQKFDCLVSAGYTIMASGKHDYLDNVNEKLEVVTLFPSYNISGNRSKLMA